MERRVRDILDASGVSPDAKSIIFHAADGYTTSLPLTYFYDNDILMAYAMNGVRIPPERGFPFMLVAEDKWGYKWCKWITELELSSDPDPGGYWEDRGYNNSGDRDRAFFGS
jgi:DMSO/TMAO reductase YedYZ molybdopterin-dependent catalytic subunit